MQLEVEGWKHNAGRKLLLSRALSSAVSDKGVAYSDRTCFQKSAIYCARNGIKRKSAISVHADSEVLRSNGRYQIKLHLSQSDMAKLFAEVFANQGLSDVVKALKAAKPERHAK